MIPFRKSLKQSDLHHDFILENIIGDQMVSHYKNFAKNSTNLELSVCIKIMLGIKVMCIAF